MTIKYFWERPISGDTSRHGTRGVANATDFTGPRRSLIHAPFAGTVSYQWFGNGRGAAGWRVRVRGVRFDFFGAHLNGNDSTEKGKGSRPARRKIGVTLHRGVIGEMGLTGDTSGSHIHAFVIDRKTDVRYSFAEWLIWRKGIRNVPDNMARAVTAGTVIPV